MTNETDDSILRTATRVARLGGWSVSVAEWTLTWSGETARIFDEPPGFCPPLEKAFDYYAPEHHAAVRAAFMACVAQGTAFEVEAQIITRKGKRVWIRVIGEALRNAAGEVTDVQGAFQSITDQKASADQIRGLSARLHDTLETITDAFFTLDRQWRFTYLNAAAERLLERKREDLLGKGIWVEFAQAVGTASDVEYHRAMDEGRTVEFEQFYPPLNRWFEAKGYPSREGVAVYFRDTTARHASEARIHEQATLLDNANDAILVRDLAHQILYWNRSAERLYGWSATEAVGRSVRELLYADPSAFNVATEATISKGEWTGEIEQRTRDGRTLMVEGRWTLMRDAAGNPKSVLAINTDITQRKKLEAQFLRAQRLESIGALAGGIAHDINNTLAPILMTVSLLREEERDPARREDLATIEACAQRGADMVRQLLLFARGQDATRTKLDVAKIAAEIHKIARDTFPKNIGITLKTPIEAWEVHANATQLNQLLMNLCVNARDAMPDGGSLAIAVEHTVLDAGYAQMNLEAKQGPYVVLRVEDTGTGMPPAVIDRIFDPFFTTKEIGKGTGLGLSTSHSIVRNHGGFIHVYSEVGKGTRFRVYLPAEVSVAKTEAVALELSSLPRGNGELVLVVDDEAPIRDVVQRMLERFGYRVLLASNGAEAISHYASRRHEVAVVLTDMAMPVMDGPATIVALRTLNPLVRIIGSSGLSANGNVAKAVGAGVRHFVPKPYSAEVMLKILRTILTES